MGVLFFLACVLMPTSPSAQGQEQFARADEDEFTRLVAGKIRREVPDVSVEEAGRLTLKAKIANGELLGQINLDRVWTFCSRNAQRCNEAVSKFVSSISETARDKLRPIEKSMVRLVVRPDGYVAQLKQATASGSSGSALFVRPLVADLRVVPVVDFSRSMRFVNTGDLEKLGLDEEGVFNLGRQNLLEKLRPLQKVVQTLPPNAFGRLAEDDYEPSRIILHGEWAPVAKQLKGNLIVMVPASNLLVYGDGSTRVGIEAMRRFAVEAARRSERPLSPVVLRWNPKGWEAVK